MEERNQEDGGEQLLVISKRDLDAIIGAGISATAHILGGIEAEKNIEHISTGYDPTNEDFTIRISGLQIDEGQTETHPIHIRTLDGLPVRWNTEDFDPNYGLMHD